MIHNKSILITAGFAAAFWFIFKKLKPADKKEVAEFIGQQNTRLVQHHDLKTN